MEFFAVLIIVGLTIAIPSCAAYDNSKRHAASAACVQHLTNPSQTAKYTADEIVKICNVK